MSPRYIVAIPLTAWRVPSCLKKVLYAAMKGRGIAVVSTVSSMSLTMPKVVSGATTKTDAEVSAARGDSMRRSCHPGARPWSMTVRSMMPERSDRVRTSRSPTCTVSGSPAAGVVKKERQPRRSLSALRSSSQVAPASAAAGAYGRRVMSTRPSTRSVVVEP